MNAYRFSTTIREDRTVVLPSDTPTGVAEVVVLYSEQTREPADDSDFFETLIRMAEQVPADELARVPTDAAINLDHYLYGAPKQDS